MSGSFAKNRGQRVLPRRASLPVVLESALALSPFEPRARRRSGFEIVR
jgi:hypothetical protein